MDIKTTEDLHALASRLNVDPQVLAAEMNIQLQPRSKQDYTQKNVTIAANTIDYQIKPAPLGEVHVPAIVSDGNTEQQPVVNPDVPPARVSVEVPPVEKPQIRFPAVDSDLQEGIMFAISQLNLSSISPETMLIVQLMRDMGNQSSTFDASMADISEVIQHLTVASSNKFTATEKAIYVTNENVSSSTTDILDRMKTLENLCVAIIKLIIKRSGRNAFSSMKVDFKDEERSDYVEKIIQEAKSENRQTVQDGSEPFEEAE